VKPIDWLLGHLDEPGVVEIVLGIGRPAAVRTADGFRPITSMNFDRNDIETLVAGTPMSNLIGSPTSLPPTEIQIDARRLIIEVVRQGYNAALRITLVGAQAAATRDSSTTVPPRTVATTAPPRTVTPTASPQTPAAADASFGVRMSSSTASPRTMTPTAPAHTPTPPAPMPVDDVPVVRMTSSTISPRTVTPTPISTPTPAPTPIASPTPQPRPTPVSTPPLTVTPLSTRTMPRITTEPAPAPAPEPAPVVSAPESTDDDPPPVVDNLDHNFAQSLGGGGEIVDYEDEPLPGYPEDAPALPPPDWYGPQIIDEHTDITALHALLEAAYKRGASDLHVIANQPITIRRLGELGALDAKALTEPFDRAVYSALFGPLDAMMAERFMLPLLGPSSRQRLAEVGYVDLGFNVPGRGRVRANISQQQDGLAGCFRLCRDRIPTLAGLGLPQDLEKTVRHHQGLVVIAGPSGHGKTTTMAALVDLLNTSNSDHIITIEDPVEIEHPAKRALVSHAELRHGAESVTPRRSRRHRYRRASRPRDGRDRARRRRDGPPRALDDQYAVCREDDRSSDRHVPARRSGAGSSIDFRHASR
jgi:hypothetical protein